MPKGPRGEKHPADAITPPLAEVETLIAKVRALGYAGAVEVLATRGRE